MARVWTSEKRPALSKLCRKAAVKYYIGEMALSTARSLCISMVYRAHAAVNVEFTTNIYLSVWLNSFDLPKLRC